MIKKIVKRIIKWIMANYDALKTAIRNAVYENGNNEITGQALQDVLEAVVNSLGSGFQFASVATTETEPGTPDSNVMYIAGAGTYPNFGGTIVPRGGLGVFRYNGEWIYSVIDVASWADASNKLYYNTQAGNVAAKTIQADGFTLQPGGWLKVHFDNANTAANPTLNVNNTGAHTMTFNGQLVSETNSWKVGETVAFYYDNYGVGIWRGIRLVELPDFVNVNNLVGQSTPFASASVARTAIPQQNRKAGLNITYLLTTGENTSQWVQDMFIGDDVTDWNVADNWKVVGPVSVSQNTETGEDFLNIGQENTAVLDGARLVKLEGIGTIASETTGITGIGQYYYNDVNLKLWKSISYHTPLTTADFVEVPLYQNALYIYNSKIYIWDGTDFKLRGHIIALAEDSATKYIALSLDGVSYTLASQDNIIRIWGGNIEDIDNAIDGQYIDKNGVIIPKSGWLSTKLIPYEHGNIIKWHYGSIQQSELPASAPALVFLDENEDFISGAYWQVDITNEEKSISASDIERYAPNAKFFIASFYDNGEYYLLIGDEEWTRKEIGIVPLTKEVEEQNKEIWGGDKENITDIVVGEYTDKNGERHENEKYLCTKLIPYEHGNIIKWHYGNVLQSDIPTPAPAILFYDKNGTVINNAYWLLAASLDEKTISLSDIDTYAPNARYVKASFYAGNPYFLQIGYKTWKHQDIGIVPLTERVDALKEDDSNIWGGNVEDIIKTIDNCYVRSSGVKENNDDFFVSKMIPFVPSLENSILWHFGSVPASVLPQYAVCLALFDENKDFITGAWWGMESNMNEKTISGQDIIVGYPNARYIQASFYKNNDTYLVIGKNKWEPSIGIVPLTKEMESTIPEVKRLASIDFDARKITPILANMARPFCFDEIPPSTIAESPLMLLWASDMHSNKVSYDRFVRFYKQFGDYINDIVHTGDTVGYYTSSFAYWYFNKILQVIGDHEYMISNQGGGIVEWATSKNVYDKFVAPYRDSWGSVVFPENAASLGLNYYYKDYADKKVRFIALDFMEINLNPDSTQVSWLESVLNDVLANHSDYHVVIGAHRCAFQKMEINPDNPFTSIDVQNWGYISPNVALKVQSYIDAGGHFACYLTGHEHTDHFGVGKDYPMQLNITVATADFVTYSNTTDMARVEDTNCQDLFNVIAIDTYSNVIKLHRIGAEYDRLCRRKNVLCYYYGNEEFDSTTSYRVGKIILKDGHIYKFMKDHSGAWNIDDVLELPSRYITM